MARLLEPTAGRVIYDGQDISHLVPATAAAAPAGVQMIFQDPYSSLNPRRTVGGDRKRAAAASSTWARGERQAAGGAS